MSRTRNLGNLTDLLTAGSTYVTTTTPPQFDTSTSIATMSAVQRALGNFQGFVSYSAAQTLTTAQTGMFIELTGSSAFTVTLPAPTTAALTYTISNVSSVNITITTPSGNIFNIGASAASVTVGASTSVQIVSDGGNWLAINGIGASLKSGSGYQKLSSGLILQWGLTGAVTSGGTLGVIFPISFTTAVFSVVLTYSNSSGSTPSQGSPNMLGAISLTGFNVINGGSAGAQYFYQAIGI